MTKLEKIRAIVDAMPENMLCVEGKIQDANKHFRNYNTLRQALPVLLDAVEKMRETLEFYANCKEVKFLVNKTHEEIAVEQAVFGSSIRYQEFAGAKAKAILVEVQSLIEEIEV